MSRREIAWYLEVAWERVELRKNAFKGIPRGAAEFPDSEFSETEKTTLDQGLEVAKARVRERFRVGA